MSRPPDRRPPDAPPSVRTPNTIKRFPYPKPPPKPKGGK